ncbi:1-phosphofructokinase [Siculibacillus lacustris]|uniref:Phosphofructokinase n=1 Tax=Siculibacillus lacustris TaxID=1549641 RepID=A0A4Q9VI52_9HYPH|nr:1-phosphofructokinase [Siculibacillus lacustris]TBW34873.1 1-phosphofructokinase [Siculibacillus lacustris]
MSAPTVITVTLNPAIDLTVTVENLTLGTVQRARASQTNVGGKGINVAGCLADWGTPVLATGILGRINVAAFAEFFAAKGIGDRFVRIDGETRTNIKIADVATGDTTDVNLPGPPVDHATYDSVVDTLDEEVRPGTLVVLAGSVPAGLPDRATTDLIGLLGEMQARVVLDTSGPALAAALDAPAGQLPFAVKPNREELEAWAGRLLPTTADLVATARQLVERGIALVVVSLGPEGALFVDAHAALAARLPPLQALSTVGAGDAMVAGLVSALADDLDLGGTARRAVAFASAKLGRVGPHLPSRAEVEHLARAATVTVLDV